MVKKPENTGGQKLATGGLCRGSGDEALSRRRQGGVGAEPPPLKIFAFLPKIIFSALNCIIYCNNVLCIMHHANTKCSDM